MAALNTPPAGTLYVVATPIGNLGDLSTRTHDILANVAHIACEDTRVTGKLLSHLEFKAHLLPYHEHNEQEQAAQFVTLLQAGEDIALVSDAGTPAISDPGFRLVRACHRAGITVLPIPGPCAYIAALSASGLPTHRVLYEGFLPAKSAARIRFLEQWREFEGTIALYESRHRIEKFLNEILSTLGPDRVISIARELTKRHETLHTGSAGEIVPRVLSQSLKGEFVVLIAPATYQL